MNKAIKRIMRDCNGECDTTGERDSRLCYDRYNEGWGKKCTHSLWTYIVFIYDIDADTDTDKISWYKP